MEFENYPGDEIIEIPNELNNSLEETLIDIPEALSENCE